MVLADQLTRCDVVAVQDIDVPAQPRPDSGVPAGQALGGVVDAVNIFEDRRRYGPGGHSSCLDHNHEITMAKRMCPGVEEPQAVSWQLGTIVRHRGSIPGFGGVENGDREPASRTCVECLDYVLVLRTETRPEDDCVACVVEKASSSKRQVVRSADNGHLLRRRALADKEGATVGALVEVSGQARE